MRRYLSLQQHGAILVFFLLHACSTDASYSLRFTVHSYANPSGRCVECQPGLGAGCCDETTVRPDGQLCPNTSVCDPIITFCTRDIGGVCEDQDRGHFNYYVPNSNSIAFDTDLTGDFNEPWAGIEVVLTPRDCSIDENLLCGDNYAIDNVTVIINTSVGSSILETTYYGDANIAQFNISYIVTCTDDQYGGDCNTTCSDFNTCEGCGLAGFTGEFCQHPAENCSLVHCYANGVCTDRSPVCDCRPGYMGDRCETDIYECEGVNCSGHGRCEDGVNNYVCVCDPTYTGVNCETFDPCSNVSCSNNGVCVDLSGGFMCECGPDYTGTFCENEITVSSSTEEKQGITLDTGLQNKHYVIAGGVVGTVAGLTLLVAVLIAVCCGVRKSKRNANTSDSNTTAVTTPADEEKIEMTRNQIYGVSLTTPTTLVDSKYTDDDVVYSEPIPPAPAVSRKKPPAVPPKPHHVVNTRDVDKIQTSRNLVYGVSLSRPTRLPRDNSRMIANGACTAGHADVQSPHHYVTVPFKQRP